MPGPCEPHPCGSSCNVRVARQAAFSPGALAHMSMRRAASSTLSRSPPLRCSFPGAWTSDDPRNRTGCVPPLPGRRGRGRFGPSPPHWLPGEGTNVTVTLALHGLRRPSCSTDDGPAEVAVLGVSTVSTLFTDRNPCPCYELSSRYDRSGPAGSDREPARSQRVSGVRGPSGAHAAHLLQSRSGALPALQGRHRQQVQLRAISFSATIPDRCSYLADPFFFCPPSTPRRTRPCLSYAGEQDDRVA